MIFKLPLIIYFLILSHTAHSKLFCDLEFIYKAHKMNKNFIHNAYKIANKAHQGIMRRHEGLPYIVHPERVARNALQYTKDQDLIAAALLHDVLEDSSYTYSELKNLFGKRVANLVQELTSDQKLINQLGKTVYLSRKLLRISDDALLIKLLDRKDNLGDLKLASRDFVRKYSKSTRIILNSIKSRKLTSKHKQLIKEIEIILKSL